MCMMAPCTPPNFTVPTKNPPILALYLGIFNGPFLKNKNTHWSFETTQLSIFSTPSTNLSSNLLCFEGLQRQQGVWCDVDEGIASSISQGEIPNCRILDCFFDHIGFWLSPWSSRECREEESLPHTKDRQSMRVWSVAFPWFRKIFCWEKFEVHLKHPQCVVHTPICVLLSHWELKWAITFRLEVRLEESNVFQSMPGGIVVSMEGTFPDSLFCRGFVSTYFVFPHRWWLGHDGNDLARAYFVYGYLYLYCDT